jgi:hypothetical protein
MNICVYGSLNEPRNPKWTELAAEFGRQLARRGHTFLFGGGGTGLLGAAARAAREEGAALCPIVRGDKHWETPLEGLEPWLETFGYRERKQAMEEQAEGFVVLPGGIGTLDECVETLILESRWKPVAIYQPDGYYATLRAFFRRAQAEGLLSTDWDLERCFCDTLEQVWERLERTR